MANENVIQATFDGFYKTYTEPSWFIDHGMELSISGIDLPDEFECHFSNSRSVAAKRQIGENGVVTIPDEYFLSNAPQIFCWIYLHPTVDSGVTEYEIVIPLLTRPNVDPAEPTQEQQDIVDQAIAALNVAMEATSADAESASASATAAQAAVDSVLNMTVSADTLPSGSDASVTKSVVDDAVHLAFGIPQGVQGVQGEQGVQGPTGATPNFTIGTVQTLLPTQDATATITGTAEAPVLNFGIPKGYSGDATNLAADYSSNKTYAVGEYCIYNGSLYRCITAITTAETWTAAHWAAAVLGDDVSNLKSALNGIDDVIKYYIYKASKTLINRYTYLKSGISLKKDIEYIATWTFSQAALDTAYCYLVDSNDTNIFPGTTSLTAGKSSFTVTFTPSADLDNITAKVYAGTGSGLVGTVCDFKIESTGNKIATIEKKISGLLPSAVGNMKTLMPFTVGSLDESGEVYTTYKKRISSTDKLQYTEAISVKMTNGYRIGYCEFVNDAAVWHGWYNEVVIPSGTLFRLQCARPSAEESASSDITDPYVNDIMDNMQILGLPDSVLELQKEVSFEFGHNGLKCEEFMDYGLWSQGAAHVDDYIVGFKASNDSHTNTATYDTMEYKNGYVYRERGNHNLGHCASADYNNETDTLLVANGTYAQGVVPTVYLITGAKAIVENGGNISVSDSNVIELPFSTIEGEGCVACFGENSNIMYVLTTENASDYSSYGGKYLYKMFLGKGSTDLTSLYPNDSYGTFINGKADNEYNGTVRVLKEYVGQYFIELQGMKYVNGRICFSCDFKIDNILTSYLLFVKTVDSDESMRAENAYWIPSLDAEGNYLPTESEGVVFADGYGYVTIFRSNNSKTLKFALLE